MGFSLRRGILVEQFRHLLVIYLVFNPDRVRSPSHVMLTSVISILIQLYDGVYYAIPCHEKNSFRQVSFRQFFNASVGTLHEFGKDQ